MPSEIARMLGGLAKMKGADRAAILAKLTSDERRLLTHHATLATAKAAPGRPEKQRRVALPPCSPWLSKRLTAMLDTSDASATEAARDAARIAIAKLVRVGAP